MQTVPAQTDTSPRCASLLETVASVPDLATDPAVVALRAKLIGDKVTIEQVAVATGRTERCIYKAIEQHKIPFVRLFGTRYIAPDALKAALLGEEPVSGKRGRGRPRKIAA